MPTTARAARAIADRYLADKAELDPFLATTLGARDDDRMRDLSPAGQDGLDELAKRALRELDELGDDHVDDDDRRCARLLRERLMSALACSEIGEHLRAVSNIMAPVQMLRTIFTIMPAATADDWAVIARRMAKLPTGTGGFVQSLTEGARRGLFAAPRQVGTFADQLAVWSDGWFADFVASADVPDSLRGELDAAAATAQTAAADLRTWLLTDYLPRADGTPDAVGADRYGVSARLFLGVDLDPYEAYDWAWDQLRELTPRLRTHVEGLVPGGTLADAVAYLDQHGEVVEGEAAIRLRLQELIDTAMADLNGTHFDIADPVKRVESRIAPAGSAADPYYTRPSTDFARPGRTWLPTLGSTTFPVWRLVSTWYHESVPGHHLQFGHWTTLADRLSRYQTGHGSVSAMTEGWALYAERLMDEFGYLADPGARLSYLTAQVWRVVRVIIDIGMHLELEIPADSPVGPGQRWTPELGWQLMRGLTERSDSYVDSALVRYLGVPGQSISYKLGERAWLAGRDAARRARGDAFDLKTWHMSALSLGALGLGDLTAELAVL